MPKHNTQSLSERIRARIMRELVESVPSISAASEYDMIAAVSRVVPPSPLNKAITDGLVAQLQSDVFVARMAAHGFTLQTTGGDCTAYIRFDGEIGEMVTLQHEPRAPEKLTDAVAIGTYDKWSGAPVDHNDDGEMGYTFGDVLAALEDPRAEYMLLTLRLFNDYGK